MTLGNLRQSLLRLFPLIVILLISATLRYFKLASLFHWTMDEEFWAYLVRNIATGYHFPLIGGHIAGTGLYSGPLFVWLMAPYFWLIKSHPLGIAFFVSTTGIFTTFLVYYITSIVNPLQKVHQSPTNRRESNRSFSTIRLSALSNSLPLLAALIYTTSTLVVLYDRKYWNPFLAPLTSSIALLLVYRLRTRPHWLTSVLLALIVTLAFHAHMTGAVLILFTLISWILYRLPLSQLKIYLVAFLLLQTPLALFDLRHDFLNTKAALSLISHQTSKQLSLQPITDVTQLTLNTTARFIYTPATDIRNELTLCNLLASARSIPSLAYQLLAAIFLCFAFYQLKHKNIFALIFLSNLILMLVYRLVAPPGSWYAGQLAEYYFLPSFTALAVLLAQAAHQLYRRFPLLTTTLILFLLVINLHTTLNLRHTDSYIYKQELVQKVITQLNHQPFSLQATGHPCSIYGIRYLFTVSGREPVNSYMDNSFLWLYQDNLPQIASTHQVTIHTDSATIDITPLGSAQPQP